jgi:hypothetical protein
MDNLPIWVIWIAALAVGLAPGLAILCAPMIARLRYRLLWPRLDQARGYSDQRKSTLDLEHIFPRGGIVFIDEGGRMPRRPRHKAEPLTTAAVRSANGYERCASYCTLTLTRVRR